MERTATAVSMKIRARPEMGKMVESVKKWLKDNPDVLPERS